MSTMRAPDKSTSDKLGVKHCFPKRVHPPKPDILDMADDVSNLQDSILPIEDQNGSMSDIGYMSSENYSLDVSSFDEPTVPLSYESSDDPFNVAVDQKETEEGSDDDCLLSQFNFYFRRKLEMELQAFHNCMHSMLSEQQLHFRNIITSSQQENLDTKEKDRRHRSPKALQTKHDDLTG